MSNLYTHAEAPSKWCWECFDNAYSSTRTRSSPRSRPTDPPGEAWCCHGATCPAWTWYDNDQTDPIGNRRGYCGSAGAPGPGEISVPALVPVSVHGIAYIAAPVATLASVGTWTELTETLTLAAGGENVAIGGPSNNRLVVNAAGANPDAFEYRGALTASAGNRSSSQTLELGFGIGGAVGPAIEHYNMRWASGSGQHSSGSGSPGTLPRLRWESTGSFELSVFYRGHVSDLYVLDLEIEGNNLAALIEQA